MKEPFPRPAVVAHRGASSELPENTLAAFEEAARVGADMVELDVRLTADGVPVVLHDPELGRAAARAGARPPRPPPAGRAGGPRAPPRPPTARD
jgi:glycerophosphoryl diester phosphodiesterase